MNLFSSASPTIDTVPDDGGVGDEDTVSSTSVPSEPGPARIVVSWLLKPASTLSGRGGKSTRLPSALMPHALCVAQ